MRKKRSGEASGNTEARPAISIEEAVKRSVKLAEKARWDLAPDLDLDDREDQVLLLLLFLVWSSYVMIDWSIWTSSPRDSTDEEIRRVRAEYLMPVYVQEWISRQIDLLVWDGHLEPGERELAEAELKMNCQESFGLPLLPATKQEMSIFGSLLRRLERECVLNSDRLRIVQRKMYVMMEEIQGNELLRL